MRTVVADRHTPVREVTDRELPRVQCGSGRGVRLLGAARPRAPLARLRRLGRRGPGRTPGAVPDLPPGPERPPAPPAAADQDRPVVRPLSKTDPLDDVRDAAERGEGRTVDAATVHMLWGAIADLARAEAERQRLADSRSDDPPAGYVVLVEYPTGGIGLAVAEVWPEPIDAAHGTRGLPVDPGEPLVLGAVYRRPAALGAVAADGAVTPLDAPPF